MNAVAAETVAAAVETDYASYFGSAFAGPETTVSVAACETEAKVADSASVYSAACETAEEAAGCGTEATVAVCDFGGEVGGFASVYSEECATAVSWAAEGVAAYVADASDEY